MSDAFWVALFTSAIPSMFTVMMTIILAYMNNRTQIEVKNSRAKSEAEAKENREKTKEVSDQLRITEQGVDVKLGDLKKVTTSTHTLVNSNMEKALQVSAIALRRVADITNNEGDAKAAEIAESALADHQAKQAVVDQAAADAEPTSVVKAVQKTLGDITQETLKDVKIVKEDVKGLKDDKDK